MARYFLRTVFSQQFPDGRLHRLVDAARAAQVAGALMLHARGTVARAASTVLRFALGRQPKTFLRAFVSLLLRHGFATLGG